jgi:hypothetical protein
MHPREAPAPARVRAGDPERSVEGEGLPGEFVRERLEKLEALAARGAAAFP